jgi:thymidylate synthase
MISLIVAFTTKGFVIGKNGSLPWDLPEDLDYFSKKTINNIVVMGRKTYESLPDKHKPLKDRLNIVITSTPTSTYNESLVYLTIDEFDKLLEYISSNNIDNALEILSNTLCSIPKLVQFMTKDVFIIGGECLFKKYVGVANKIFATLIDLYVEDGDTYFPISNFGQYKIESYMPQQVSKNNINYQFVTYTKDTKVHDEYQYLNMLNYILHFGQERPDRTHVGTKSIFAPNPLRFDVSKTIPMYTTKFVGFKSVVKELLWFMRGQTDSKILEKEGVNIWRDNTTREFLDKRCLSNYREGDCGELYGVNFRAFGAEYKGCDHNHIGEGVDQLQNFIDGIKIDPFSRRHLITTFNPSTVHKAVLYPCHGLVIQGYPEDINGKMHLSLHVYIRSQDCVLGNPYNVTSYAVFIHILAKLVDMIPKELVISFGDAHIYQNHYDQVKLQLQRKPLPFPIIEISDSIKNKKIEHITVDDIKLYCYLSHPSIKAQMAV